MALFPGRWQARDPAQALFDREPCYLCGRKADLLIGWGPGQFIVVCAGHLGIGRLYVACQLATVADGDLDAVLARMA